MKNVFPVEYLRQMTIPKPEFRQPCNNCGLCCRVQACHVSKMFLKSEQAPCIALEVHDGKFLCGMILRPAHYLGIAHLEGAEDTPVRFPDGTVTSLRDGIARLLEAGQGCTMPDEIALISSKDVKR